MATASSDRTDWSDNLLGWAYLGAIGTWIAFVASFFISRFNGMSETACQSDPYHVVPCTQLPDTFPIAVILGIITLGLTLAGLAIRSTSIARRRESEVTKPPPLGTPPSPPGGTPPLTPDVKGGLPDPPDRARPADTPAPASKPERRFFHMRGEERMWAAVSTAIPTAFSVVQLYQQSQQ